MLWYVNPVRHIKTADQRTIIQQYGDWYTGCSWVGCYICYREKGPGRAAAPPSPLLTVPNVTVHQSTASVPTSYYSMWHYNCLWMLRVKICVFDVTRVMTVAWWRNCLNHPTCNPEVAGSILDCALLRNNLGLITHVLEHIVSEATAKWRYRNVFIFLNTTS